MPRSIAEEFVEAPLPGHRIHTISLGVNSQDTRFTRSLHLFGAPPKSEAKPRSIQGASRTSYRPDTLSRLHTNIEMHDWRSMSRSLTRASRAPQARCRQSILRRRRPRTCGRRCRAPRSWPPSAKRRSKKLSPATTTSLETPVWAMPLRAPHGGKSDNVGQA